MTKRDEHSIRGEPIYRYTPPRSPDAIADEPAFADRPAPSSDEERARHNVWDEPSLRAAGATPPPEALTYSRWYAERLRASTWWESWGTVALLALCGGPFAIAGTIAVGFSRGYAVEPIVVTVIGPALEEMMKIGAILIVLENRPYLFRSGLQLVLAAMASGLVFAVVENLMYIHWKHPEGTELFRTWRWTVCTALHVCTTTIAGLGLLRVWRHATRPGGDRVYQAPQSSRAFPLIAIAVVLHGIYNALAIAMGMAWGPL